MSLICSEKGSFPLDESTFVDLIESNDFAALTAAKTFIERRMAALRDEQIVYLRQYVLEQTALLGLTPADLFDAAPTTAVTEVPKSAKRDASGAPKYKDPNSAATWTGKGKPPLWMKAHLEAGGVKDDLLIDGKGSQEVLLTAATNEMD